MSASQEMAEDIGIKALIWLAGNEDLLPVFLGASGASVNDIKAQAGEPAFLASVLDFLLMDDAWVMGFCEAEGLKYEQPMRARAALPGGEQVNWT
ncbi:DUF3572 domain-containing protein [Lentibacter sp. XHP0401]|jgi:Protein of unknown function (DUF3572)|uniref:DUF3572 domain-containing protein n=1 Tax=Lentibacter sp. XHP0401 TaxID=2984334 RepID=UPI0021E7F08D|nr:DUF3572 domain-containing protein [Lentibacter sp. XHP0401]MCV2893003.1 DUF3572 domain-containing protein [Lentibacter sp. XHP0401]